MDTKAIGRARTALVNAGSLADRNDLRSRLMADLRNDIDLTHQRKEATSNEYRRQLERWRTEAVSKNATVCAISSDLADARLYRVTAVFALLAEMGLAAWVFWRLNVGWLFGALAALFVTVTLHGALLQLFNDPERPKATVYRLRKFAVLPAFCGFLLSLGIGVLARYVTGGLALLLLPLFSFSLWLGTLSLMLLAASLFTLAHVLSWSERHERDFRRLDKEARASEVFLGELERDAPSHLGSRSIEASASVSGPVDGKASTRHGATLSMIVLLSFVLYSSAGCSTAVSSAEEPPRSEGPADQTSGASLHILIDTSGSCVRSALEECLSRVKIELPTIIQSHRIIALTIATFDEDGWCPKRLSDISLPPPCLPSQSQQKANEWESFANIREAVRESEERQRTDSRKAAEAEYLRSVSAALRPLDDLAPLPDPNHESRESDPVGLLKRISQMREEHPQLFVVITDMADTKHKEVPVIPAPDEEVGVLVLLVPAQAKDATLTTGKPLSGPEQFELRSRQLRQAAPWVVAAPFFAKNLSSLFRSGH